MADEEFMDAADDWELEAMRQEEEEQERLQEEERARKERDEKERKRRLAAEAPPKAATTAVADGSSNLTDDAKVFLENAQREFQDAQAAATLLGGKVEYFADRSIKTEEEAKALGADIAQRFAQFDGDHLSGVAGGVFESLLKAFVTSKELRELETMLNVAKSHAKAAKHEKKADKVVTSHNALDLDTTDRGGAAEAQDDCGW